MGMVRFQDVVCFVWQTMTSCAKVAILPRQDRVTQENGKEEWDEHWIDRRSNCKLHQGRKAISALVYLNAFPMTAVPMLAMIWKTGWRSSPYELLRWWRGRWTSCKASPEHLGDQLEESVYIWRKREDFFVWDGFARGRSKAACTLCLACDPAQQQHSYGTK